MHDAVWLDKEIPVIASFDVLVVGAGPAGVCAAISATALDTKVGLIEKFGFSGGMATAGYVGPILGVYHWASETKLLGGIGLRILEEMEALGGAILQTEGMLVPFDPEVMKYVCDRQLEAHNVEVFYHTTAAAVVKEDGAIRSVIVSTGQGLAAINCSVCIDCTGDGLIAYLAEVPFVMGDEHDGSMMPMTTVFRLGNVDSQRIHDSENPEVGYVATEIRERLVAAHADKQIPSFGGPWIMRGSTVRDDQAFVNMVRQWGDPTDPKVMSRCEIDGRADMFRLTEYMKAHEPALVDSYILDSGATIGVRDSRHFFCKKRLTLADCIGQKSYIDSIGLGGHIVDIHATDDGSTAQRRDTIPYYEIPLSSLIPKKIKNLLIAGRAFDAEYAVFASARVMGTCMIMGQGAGAAAAWAVAHNKTVDVVDVAWLRKHLMADGVPLMCTTAD